MARDRPGFTFPLDLVRAEPNEPGRPSARVFSHGTMTLRYYQPKGADPQPVHDQDEVYIVVRGSGQFVNGDEGSPFGPGDALFVRAQTAHRFEAFTDDLEVWVVFYGPAGGEQHQGPV